MKEKQRDEAEGDDEEEEKQEVEAEKKAGEALADTGLADNRRRKKGELATKIERKTETRSRRIKKAAAEKEGRRYRYR